MLACYTHIDLFLTQIQDKALSSYTIRLFVTQSARFDSARQKITSHQETFG